MHISDLVKQAGVYFRTLAESQTLPTEESATAIQTQHERFDNWARHVGREGLDYALKDSTSLSTTVKDLLEDLIADLSECQEQFSEQGNETSDDSDQESSGDLSHRTHLFESIEESIQLLERLNSTLLEHEPHDFLEKDFVAKVQQFETQDSWIVYRRFPSAPAYIQQRLGKAIAKRRVMISRRISRRNQGNRNADVLDASVQKDLQNILSMLEGQPREVVINENISSTSSSTGSDLENDEDRGSRYSCRLCNTSVVIGNYQHFRKHLLRDLEPYVCLYHDCPSPDRLYRSRSAWTEHVKFVHGKIWRCCFGCAQPIGTKDAFDAHLSERHRGQFTSAELPTLEELCEKHVLLDEDARCPLCRDVTTSAYDRQTHIGRHMEELAFCVLQPPDTPSGPNVGDYSYPSLEARHTPPMISQGRDRTRPGGVFTQTGPSKRAESSPFDDHRRFTQHGSGNQQNTRYDLPLRRNLETEIEPQRSQGGQDYEGRRDLTNANTSKTAERRSSYHLSAPAPPGSVRDRKHLDREGRASRSDPYKTPYRRNIAPQIEPSCAICGAPPYPECPHEAERLEIAINQATDRWLGFQAIRDWVMYHARDDVVFAYNRLASARNEAHSAYLQTLPCYSLYEKYKGTPPLQPAQLYSLQSQINAADQVFRAGIDDDWRRSVLRYPEVLDYYFSLVDIGVPHDEDIYLKGERERIETPSRPVVAY